MLKMMIYTNRSFVKIYLKIIKEALKKTMQRVLHTKKKELL